MTTTKKITIASDDAALNLLKQTLEHELKTGVEMHLTEWPTVAIRLTGPNYEGTITAATAQALIEYQRAMEHAYLRLIKPGAKRLSAEEKRRVSIKAKVDKGSTLLTIDFNEALTQIATQLIGKMSPTDITITILGLGMIAGGTLVTKAYVKERSARLVKEKELQTQLAMSAHETKRLEVVTQAMQHQPRLVSAREDFDDARDGVLRSAADATSLQFEGIELTPAQAVSMAREPRKKSVEVQLNGVYTIGAVTWSDEEAVVMDLRSIEKTLEFKATLNTSSLLQKDKDLLAKAEWSRTPLYLSINARELRDEIVNATIVGFDWEKLRANPAGALSA